MRQLFTPMSGTIISIVRNSEFCNVLFNPFEAEKIINGALTTNNITLISQMTAALLNNITLISRKPHKKERKSKEKKKNLESKKKEVKFTSTCIKLGCSYT
jgi:hypothetical protein